PRNAQCISVILKSFGITDVEPNVIYQLQEFAHRYTTDILSDAQVFSEHCGRSTINKSDIVESISSRLHHSFSGPPNQEFLRELANKTNSKPLPIIHEKFGTRLPKEKYCLTATNFQILPDV
ncbi:transcription factor TAFII-31, partial [Neoconidiobolus thromboides FSU 785]